MQAPRRGFSATEPLAEICGLISRHCDVLVYPEDITSGCFIMFL